MLVEFLLFRVLNISYPLFCSTKKKLDASPNKQELAGGSLVTAVAPEQPVAGNKKKSKNNKSRY